MKIPNRANILLMLERKYLVVYETKSIYPVFDKQNFVTKITEKP